MVWDIVFKAILGIIVVLWGGLLWFAKRSINKFDEWKDGIDKWIKGSSDKGGLVTRDDFFAWCDQKQGKCSKEVRCELADIFNWRDSIMQKGGPISLVDHIAACEKASEKAANSFAKKIDDTYLHHREWVADQLRIMTSDLEKKLSEGFAKLSKEIDHRGDGAWSDGK